VPDMQTALIDPRRELAIVLAHEATASPTAMCEILDDLVAELVDRTGYSSAETADLLFRSLMLVDRRNMHRSRVNDGVNVDDYLAGASPEFKVAVKESSRREQERRLAALADSRPDTKVSRRPANNK
jgi:hypothetical protein